MPLLDDQSYERHLQHVNQNKYYEKRPRITCVCGKTLYVSQMERHQGTKLHTELMRRKEFENPPQTE